MKINLRFAFLMLYASIYQFSYAQVTKLSNNTNLEGFAINNTPLLISNVNNTLWTTDGTPAGTKQYTTKVTNDTSGHGGAGVLGGKEYFSGFDAANGSELWVTDGTDAGTALVKDIEPGANSSTPTSFFLYNNQLFFLASTAAAGQELWKTDGTSGGTVMVKDINSGTGSITGEPYFYYFISNGVLYLQANDGIHGDELWKTDGTSAGTVLVKDINPGPGYGIGSLGGFFGEIITLGSVTLFTADNGTGAELWKTDGTEAGTVMVKDINTSREGSRPDGYIVFNNKVYFTAQTNNEGTEVWVTDGTTAGTNIVKDIYKGTESSLSALSLFNAVIFRNRFVFTATDPDNGTELWSTDGTEQGTTLLKDINTGKESSAPLLLPGFTLTDQNPGISHTPPFSGKAFLTATNSAGETELWLTDGTSQGTVLLKAISPGELSSSDYLYTQNTLFFTGDDGTTGIELWRSDGTPTGTGLLKDINPGKNSSDPTFNFVYNNHLYLTADDGDNDNDLTDLFVADENVTLPITLYNFAATALPTKAVKLEWNTTNELNSSHFDIERSADGLNFTKIDEVGAAGNSGLTKQYLYTDEQAVHFRSPVLFYRLKMVDKDAAFKYSRILAVHFNQSSFEFSFSPNPVQNQLSVIVAAAGSKSAALRVTDALGKQVYQQTLSSSQTINQHNINVSAWQKGIYYIQLITDKTVKSSKFIKQ